ncbi:HYR domain-containing protein [Pyxidicoccus fallax]|uniref:HYR domain-containing protein n=1 Tax=Pyxidicoccus fallax TaxID=394095 RepID=A0A848LMK7_9BACT|nr:HYR domain-containing protein [Pyxidicoccus fallax]NMO18941.1 HYR domain-containing protein [Pyxidicoccus fallax]NPC80187.1 HYR domain-containing protein [Pyxidicoccus fallax]
MHWPNPAPALLVAGVMAGLVGCSEPAAPSPAPAMAATRQQVDGPALLKDIDTRPVGFPMLGGFYTSHPLPGGGTLLAMTDELTGTELWRTDGTEPGTTLVKDIAPGDRSSSPRRFASFQGAIYFAAEMEAGRISLWKSDGTPAGTVLVKSFSNLPDGLGGSSFGAMAAAGGALYFLYDDTLWRSDGTEAGTTSVQGMLPPTVSKLLPGLTPMGDAVYFLAEDSAQGTGLWKTDGTAAGTLRLKDLRTDDQTGDPNGMTAVGSTLYFAAGPDGRELWKTDGTVQGTQLVSTQPQPIGYQVAVGPYLFFQDITSLWSTNGTTAGTVRLLASNPTWMVEAGGALFFAVESALGHELWVSNGTVAGTRRVKSLGPDAQHGASDALGSVNGRMLLVVSQGNRQVGLWSSDGSEAGTVLLAERTLNTDPIMDGFGQPAVTVGTSVLVAFEEQNAPGPVFRTDGTAAGTVELREARRGTRSSQVEQRPLGVTPGKVFFLARDEGGLGLWVSDAIPGGTLRLGRFSGVNASATVGSTLYFVARDASHDPGLWKSDGTVAGTVKVKDFPSTDGSFPPHSLTAFRGALYFTATADANGEELWRSNGTADGTVRVLDLAPGSQGSYPVLLQVMNDTLYFSAMDSNFRRALWRSDGTANGTVKVKDVNLSNLVVGGDTLYLLTDDNSLWKSDGTADGTVRIREDLGSVWELAWVNGRLYMGVADTAHGYEPWVSDGTTEGTHLLKDIQPGPTDSGGISFRRLGNQTLFFAQDDAHGLELWRTDGTEAGTVRVTDLMPGPLGSVHVNNETDNFSDIFELVPLEDRGLAVFAAQDPARGLELWATDGTTEGTFRHADLAPGEESSAPTSLAVVGDQLFAFAGDAAHGREPRAVPLPLPPDTTKPTVSCPTNVSVTTADAQGTTVEYPAATANDDRGPPTLAYSQASGTRFPTGATPVTVTATDAAGNTAQCTFTVTVTQQQSPPPPDSDEDSGCGCTSGMAPGAGAGWGLLLLALASLRARRRG